MHLHIQRKINIPDWIKIARYAQAPHLGPRILFFSGGTALRDVSRRLIDYTHNSIHVMTPFDSGGSSAVLRHSFNMPAVGDIRNRLMALADQSIHGNPAVYDLFSHRLPPHGACDHNRTALRNLMQGKHPLISAVPDPLQHIIRRHLSVFSEYMPPDFDLCGASIGNLILAAGYLENERELDPVIFLYSKLAEVRGTVRAVARGSYYLGAELADGRRILGQHLLTGKGAPCLESPISSLFLTRGLDKDRPCPVQADPEVISQLSDAELICYPMGSFFTSLLANLLPDGIASGIRSAACPKVFIPNTCFDPECPGMTLQDQVRTLLDHVGHTQAPVSSCLNYILLDASLDRYPGGADRHALESLGVHVVISELVTGDSAPHIDPDRLVPLLLSLA